MDGSFFEKTQKELERQKKENIITQRKEELENLKAEWRELDKRIINFCLEEEVLELLSNGEYKIIPRYVKKKIREVVFMVLGKVCDEYKGFLMLDSRRLLKTYFPIKLGEMQEFLNVEQERVERVREEEERRIQTRLLYINDFLTSEGRVISKYHLVGKFLELTEDQMIQFLLEDFNERLLSDNIIKREEYTEHFRLLLPSKMKYFTKKLENRVKGLQKLETNISLREYLRDHMILLIIVISLTTLLVGFYVWLFSLPYLVRFSFETANLWIHLVIGTLIGIDIILIILLLCRN